MARKSKPSARARVEGKRAAKFRGKLEMLRKLTSEFDSKKFERLYASHPRTKRAKTEKRNQLAKVSRTFARLRPYVHRPHKLVRPTSKKHFESLRKFVGVGQFKGLKAIPVPTDRAGTLKVRFDKKARPILMDGASKQKVYLFPHVPRNHYRGGKLVKTIADDIQEMTEVMVRDMPPGQYVLFSRHHFLIPTMEDRDELAGAIRGFLFRYKEENFLKLLRGFKFVTDSYERAQRIKEHMSSERGRLKAERARIKAERAAKVIAEMDRAFKRGPISKRTRATGRR